MVAKPIKGNADWDVPLNAALDDLQTQVNAKLPSAGGTMTGPLTTQSVNTNSLVRSAFLKTTSSTEHAATVYQAGTSGTGVALNIISDNPQNSAVFVTGHESARGSIKVAHLNPGPGVADDANAAALSVDLQYNGMLGTAAQGLFITATEGPTTGNMINVRHNSRDDFVIKGAGLVGIRLPIGSIPTGALQIAQADDATVGLAIQANSATAQQMLLLKDSAGAPRFEVAGNGSSVHRAVAFFTSALQLGATSADLGGSSGSVVSIKNAAAVPTTNPTGGVIIYAEGGVLKMRTAAGAVVDLSGLLALSGGTMTGTITSSGGAVGSVAYAAQVTGDTTARYTVGADGALNWGPGNGVLDASLTRTAPSSLNTPGFLAMGSGQSSGNFSVFANGNLALKIGSAGGGLAIKEGANARSGTAVLAAGAVTVANTSVTATTRIQLTTQAPGGTVGSPYVSARVAGTSFTITSTSGTDTSTVAYFLVEPG